VYLSESVCVKKALKPNPCESRTFCVCVSEPLKPTPRESRALNRMAASPALKMHPLQ